MNTATQELLFGSTERPPRSAEAKIVIHVAGGAAHLVAKPAGIAVAVHDFDHPTDGSESITVYRAEVEIRRGEALPRAALRRQYARQPTRRGGGGDPGIREEPAISEVDPPSSEGA